MKIPGLTNRQLNDPVSQLVLAGRHCYFDPSLFSAQKHSMGENW